MAERKASAAKEERGAKSRTIVMRGPPPSAPGARTRQVDVGCIDGGLRAEAPALASHVAFLTEQLGETRRRIADEVHSLRAAEAKEESAVEELSKAQARAAEREWPSENPEDVTDEVKALRDEEARLAAESADLDAECTALRQRGLRISAEASAAETLAAQHRGLLQHAQQELDVAKEATSRLELRGADPTSAELEEVRKTTFQFQSEESSLNEALAKLREGIEVSLETAASHRLAASEEVAAARHVEASRRSAAQARQEAQLRLSRELHAARTGAAEADAKRLETRRKEEAISSASAVLGRQLAAEQAELVEAQRSRRELSSSLGHATQELEDVRGRCQAEEASIHHLQVSLETATSHRLAASEEVAAARLVEASRRSAAQVRQEAQLRLSRELQSARTGASEAEAKRIETRRKEEAISSASAVLGRQLAAEQAELVEAQRSRRELSSSLGHATQELEDVRGRCQAEEASIHHLQVEMRSVASTARGHKAATSEAAAQLAVLQAELGQRQAALREVIMEESESQASVTEARREAEAAEATAAGLRDQLQDVRHGAASTGEALRELEAGVASRQRQWAALREQRQAYKAELAECLAEIAGEVGRSAATARGPSSVRMRLQELEEESSRLHGTISGLEADQAELVQISDNADEKLRPLRSEAARVRAQRGEVQWTLDRLRHRRDCQHGELVDSTKTAASTSEAIRAVEAEVQTAQSELSERMHEVTLALDDLMHMTAENQLLHEQLQRAKSHRDHLSRALEEQDMHKLPLLQELRGHEHMRDTVLRTYQEAIDERQRKEAAVSEMSNQVASSFEEVNGLKQSLEALLHAEDTVRNQLQGGDSELAVLRAKMRDATQVLEMQEFAAQELRAESSRLRLAASSQQSAINEAVLGAAAVAAQAESLRAEVQTQQHDLEQARNHLADGQRQRDEAMKSKSQLEDLLSAQRQLQLQREAEIQAARGTLETTPTESGRALEQTLERLQRLEDCYAAEINRLSTKLRSFQASEFQATDPERVP
ncbi:unnamed protein product [Symbiodinium natans]|uniref:Uncharacterized protein n=1 Tax=Symbiodinium natans TaxID=878477 RepID=A0A812UXS2_9DINO|nr:unnamed protein product [Symbiodinium natans]